MKIAVCTPSHGDVKAGFAQSLFYLSGKTVANLQATLRMVLGRGSILPEVRNRIAGEALDWGADWLLWLDADHTFPEDTLLSLLAHDVPIVGCNYPKRLPPTLPTASRNGQPVWSRPASRGLEQVDGLGLGVCLTSARVFEALKRPWFRFDYDEGGGFRGEDATFFSAARAAGFAVHLDHTLSLQIGHITEQKLTNADTGRGYVNTVLPAAGAQ